MKNKEKANVVKWILNIIIIVLSFFFFVTVCATLSELNDAFGYNYDADSFYYKLQSENYRDMVQARYHNIMNGHNGNATLKEYYGVAEYYEMASLYKAYTVAGNEEMATHFQNKMQEAEKRMGDWNITKDSIHKQLGIE